MATTMNVQPHPTGAVLTVLNEHGIMMVSDIGEIYKLLNHLSGQDVYTHQIPMFMRYYRPLLQAAFPYLVESPGIDMKANWQWWLENCLAKYGEVIGVPEMPVAPLSPMEGFPEGKPVVIVGAPK